MDSLLDECRPTAVLWAEGACLTRFFVTRCESFNARVQLVWMVDCRDRSVAAYTTPSQYLIFDQEATIDGGNVLSGFTSPVAEFFADLELHDS